MPLAHKSLQAIKSLLPAADGAAAPLQPPSESAVAQLEEATAALRTSAASARKLHITASQSLSFVVPFPTKEYQGVVSAHATCVIALDVLCANLVHALEAFKSESDAHKCRAAELFHSILTPAVEQVATCAEQEALLVAALRLGEDAQGVGETLYQPLLHFRRFRQAAEAEAERRLCPLPWRD